MASVRLDILGMDVYGKPVSLAMSGAAKRPQDGFRGDAERTETWEETK
jgi:hypothetical protein